MSKLELMPKLKSQSKQLKSKLKKKPRRRSPRSLRRKKPKRNPRRPPRKKRRLSRRQKSQMMKSQWMPPLSRLTHQLLPMQLKTLNQVNQLSIIKLPNSMMRSHNTNLPVMYTTQTPWDQWSKTRSPKSRMHLSKLLRRKTNEQWIDRIVFTELKNYFALV